VLIETSGGDDNTSLSCRSSSSSVSIGRQRFDESMPISGTVVEKRSQIDEIS